MSKKGKMIRFKNGSTIMLGDEGTDPLTGMAKGEIFKRIVRSERKRLKKLKHAGVDKKDW